MTALIASHFKNKEVNNARETTKLLSDTTIDLGEVGKDPIYGSGLIKAKYNCSF